jgi:hypothetical protein
MADQVGKPQGLKTLKGPFSRSEGIHLVDADERTLMFAAPSSVGCVRDLLVRGASRRIRRRTRTHS